MSKDKDKISVQARMMVDDIKREGAIGLTGILGLYLGIINQKAWEVKQNRDTFDEMREFFGEMFRERAIDRGLYDIFMKMMDDKLEQLNKDQNG